MGKVQEGNEKPMPNLEGTMLGRYRLEQRLGSGGMSTVYLAFDEAMQRIVAAKVVSSEHVDYVERFRREAEAIGNLNHAHILPAFDYGEQGEWHYLIMPYIGYGTLRERLTRGRMSLEEAGEMLEQIASALQFAHNHGIIHRDIKPSNILLRDDHYAYLADFGLAKAVEGASEITQTGSLLGTPEYMAPDLSKGPATTSSDIYALGILLYEMVTGRVPFTGETPIAAYWKHLNEQPEPPSHFNPAISRSLDQVILRALEKDPRRRYQTAAALSQAYIAALRASTYYETEKMPSLSEPAEADRNYDPVPAMPPLPQQEGRLILPHPEVAAPTVIARSEGAPVQLLHPSPVAPPVRPLSPGTPSPPRQRARARRSHAARTRLLISAIITLCVVLLLVIIINLGVYYSRQQGQTRATTTSSTLSVQPTPTATAQQATPTTQPTPTSNTQATATASAQAQATATAAVAVTATSGTPILTDSLSSNTNGRWTEEATTCAFTDETYHILVKQTDFLQLCESTTLTYDNATLQVDVSLLSGNDAGLIFRVNGDKFYDFEINNKGEFFFRRHDAGAGGAYTYLINNTQSSAIAPGTGKNTLLVIANGNDFKLYINGVLAGEAQDGTYTSGQIGFVTGTFNPTASGEGSFANLKVFKV